MTQGQEKQGKSEKQSQIRERWGDITAICNVVQDWILKQKRGHQGKSW